MANPHLEHPKLNRNQVLMLVACVSFIGGALIAGTVAIILQAQHPAAKAKGLRESDISITHSEYTFIDPLIGIRGVDNAVKYASMKDQVSSYIVSQAVNGLVTASVDFRDIDEPGGFIVNPSDLYTPASLNKVPEMMAYYKLAESDPSILEDVLTYPGTNDRNAVEEIKSAVQLTPGATYTVEQLIERMIRYSDNNAANLLLVHLDDTHNMSAYTSIFSDLGMDPNILTKYTDNMTVQKYSIFLRVLYNATYLNRASSERALRLLSETDFSEGLESGVPNNVLVSEKFGEVRMTDSNGTFLGKQIHNCGIVYYPGHPYLLCVMTKATGDNIKGLEAIIAGISRIVYKNMQGFYL